MTRIETDVNVSNSDYLSIYLTSINGIYREVLKPSKRSLPLVELGPLVIVSQHEKTLKMGKNDQVKGASLENWFQIYSLAYSILLLLESKEMIFQE